LDNLTIVSAADLAAAQNWADFGKLLHRWKAASGMSLTDIHRQAKRLKLARDLPPATVSPAMNGRRPSRDVLLCLLRVFEVPATDVAAWSAAWQRLTELPAAGPLPRFDELTPRQLGIHAALATEDSPGELPPYVSRDFDDDLRECLSAGTERGCFVLLVGKSSSGKTRSLYEAVYEVAPNWPISQPAGIDELIELLNGARQRIIIWLDEMKRFFDTGQRLTKEHAIRLLQFPAIVVATLWPDDYLETKTQRGPGISAERENDRRLLDLARVVPVPDVLSSQERMRAGRIAETDSRIRLALDVKDAGLTQALAAGPELLHRWELAPDPYAKAVISFAADARRLGVLSPIPEDAFAAAAGGYLTSSQRVKSPPRWLADALGFGMAEVYGAVSALAPVDDGESGRLAGYIAADYVAQHVRRDACPPRSAWETLIATTEDADELRRLAAAASSRMRYCYQEQALRRLFDLHGEAAAEFASVLFRSGRVREATVLLHWHLAEEPDDRSAAKRLAEILALTPRIGELRAAAAAGDAEAGRHLAEMLADDGEVDRLRTRADEGSHLFEEDLAALLADRGAVDELRRRADRGRQPAADALAELLATHCRVDLLQQRADAGDLAALHRLQKLLASTTATDGTAVQAQLAHLRRRIGSGDLTAARQLTTLLFDLRNEAELRHEVDAGTFGAADRLVALLNADETVDRDVVDRLRAHGLTAGGLVHTPEEA
jgi:hypothetical protein